MFSLVKKYSPLLCLSILFFATRLFHLTILPIFNDESIHIYWAKLIATSNKQWFISLVDGEPPLFIWTIVLFLKLVPASWYLTAGRVAAVLGGYIGLVGIYHLALILFASKRTAFISGLLFIFSPFLFFYDRLASYDVFLSSFGIWSIYFSIKSAQEKNYKYILLWGLFLGLTLLSKASGVLFIGLSAVSFFITLPYLIQKREIKQIAVSFFSAIILAEGMHGLLFFSKGYHLYSSTGITRYTIPFSTLLHNPCIVFFTNIKNINTWLLTYYTIPVFILGCLGFILLLFKNKQYFLVLFSLWIVPLLGVAFAGNDPYPRHILFTTPYFLIAVSVLLEQLLLWRKRTALLLMLVLLILPGYFVMLLLTKPYGAPLPRVDNYQYISGIPSGYGLDETISFLKKASQKEPINIISLGTVSSFPHGFNLAFWDNPRVNIIAIWPVNKDTKTQIHLLSKKRKTYVILKYTSYQQHKNFLTELGLKKIQQMPKPDSRYFVYIAQPE